MTHSNLSSKELLRMYQSGHSDAATILFDKYAKRLIALARKKIGPRINRRFGPEDIVQSAYRSFFVHARNDDYQLENTGDLWRLLARIALNKLYGQIERHTASKRNAANERHLDGLAEGCTIDEPSPSEVVALLYEMAHVFELLSHDEKVVLSERLTGLGIAELAARLKKSERTVRRLLAQAKRKIEGRLQGQKEGLSDTESQGINNLAGLRYSDYVLEKMIGAGAMGKVYRARHKESGRKVAIKALRKSWQSDRNAVLRFVQESQVLSTLDHPNIVRVDGLGRFPGGGYFIVLEFVDGPDLQTLLSAKEISTEKRFSTILDVVCGVGYAHKNGIVHCDIKPANVLVDGGGRVLVTDFGFAFLDSSNGSATAHGVGGTAGYVAPEIILDGERPSPASDIYSLGVLMSELLTGQSPQPSGLPSLTEVRPEEMADIISR